MPYSVGEKGSHGCSGYPVVKTKTGEVMGCHPSQDDAMKQIYALHLNEPNATKSDSSIGAANPSYSAITSYPGVGVKYPDVNPRTKQRSRKRKRNRISPNAQSNSGPGTISSGGSGGSIGGM